MTEYYNRENDLKIKINNHLRKLTKKDCDFYSEMKPSDLIELKNVLSDINNVLTLKMTITAANWICNLFKFDENIKKSIIESVEKVKPNTKGFDIHISEPYKIIAEVKCISPVNNGGKYGAAQWNSILDDFHKLKHGKGILLDTSKHYKFVFLLDLGDRTDQAITHLLRTSKGISDKPIRANRHQAKEHISLLSQVIRLEDLGFDKVYLKKIKLDD